jgi:hypothetical protein
MWARGDEFGDGVQAAAAQRRVGQFAQPALDQIQPRRGGRGEVPVEPLVPGQPPLHVGVLGGGVDPELTLLAASSGTNTVHILGCARKPIALRSHVIGVSY